ncbi:MAG: hypothetical protein IKB25_11435 [Lentisphaeria bacterium]|nr:hypothetical protein [Lentisphaeria bacterium]
MKFSLVRRLAACTLLFFMTGGALFADRISLENKGLPGGTTGFEGVDPKTALKEIDASADLFEYVGDNVIVRGHVVIVTKTMILKADNAVIHLPTRDVEAFGNVSLVRRVTTTQSLSEEKYRELLQDVRKKIDIKGIRLSPLNKKIIDVEVTQTTAHIQAERLAGNLNSGELRFENFAMKSGALYAIAGLAHRKTSGEIVAENTRMTTCDYVIDDHDHYAFSASKAIITPRSYNSGLQNYNVDHSDHSVLLINSFLRFWDIPLLWFPALYKPRETDSFGVDLAIGHNDDWGVWVRSSKNFDLYDDPYVNVGVLMDFYSERGFGGGVTATAVTSNSRTEIFGYAIHDKDPYLFRGIENDEDKAAYINKRRFTIPKNRYDFKVTNITHITPRLDFRGQVEFISDVDFLEDFFEARFESEPQPPTFAALEYQADWASFSVLATGRVNSFDSVVQRLPELRMDIFRQELFAGLYYQSENSFAYLYNRWRDFDREDLFTQDELNAMQGLPVSQRYDLWKTKHDARESTSLKNYGSGRFDSLHMFYYPLMLDFINIVPRAGIRLTAYTATSKNEVTDEDLNTMFGVNSFYGRWKTVNNFDAENKAKLRFMSEFGVEVNTKIYQTWQNVRSSWMGLDGLRHVIIPYINYTFIPEPTLDAENILYFDDIDRLQEQHFIRFGLVNKLQTRAGNYGSEKIRQWASLETYWDFHAIKRYGYNNIGDLGVKLDFTPVKDLTIRLSAVFDVGKNNKESNAIYRYSRNGQREAKNPGISGWKYLNSLSAEVNYNFTKDLYIKASYGYSRRFWRRSVYSMGSMLEAANATSTSLKVLQSATQTASLTIGFPSYIDKHLKGEFYMVYDVNQALMEDIGVRLVRDFHCFRVGLNLGLETDRNIDGEKETSFHVSGFVGLTAMPSMQLGSKD